MTTDLIESLMHASIKRHTGAFMITPEKLKALKKSCDEASGYSLWDLRSLITEVEALRAENAMLEQACVELLKERKRWQDSKLNS